MFPSSNEEKEKFFFVALFIDTISSILYLFIVPEAFFLPRTIIASAVPHMYRLAVTTGRKEDECSEGDNIHTMQGEHEHSSNLTTAVD